MEVDLRDFELEIEEIGNEVDRGSYAVILELKYRGLKCAGKELYQVLQKSSHYSAQRYLEECKLLSKAKHPNIVQFLGIYRKEGSTFPILVMEFLPVNLSNCLERYGILPNEINFSILHDVSLGLAYLHGQTPAIIHRDLSANNILLSSNMSAKIADLGVSKILNLTPIQVSRMTETPGTPTYMPPEVMIVNPHYDTSVDMFSFGVLMVHVFTAAWPEPNCAPTRVDTRDSSIIHGVKEIERRGYLFEMIEEENPLKNLIKECLNNRPASRPNAFTTTEKLGNVVCKHPASFENRIDMLKKIRDYENDIRKLQQNMDERNIQIKENTTQIEMLQHNHEIKQNQFEDEIDSLKHGHEIEVKQLQDALTVQQINLEELSETKEMLTKQSDKIKDQEREILEIKSKLSENACKLGSLEEELVDTKAALNSAKEDLIHMISENDRLRKRLENEQKQNSRKAIDNRKLAEELEVHMQKLQSDIAMQENELRSEKAANERQKMRIRSLEALECQLKETQTYLISRKKPIQATLSFSECQDLPDLSSAGQCVTIGDNLYYSGTELDSKGMLVKRSDIYQYTISLKEWSKLPQQHQYAHFGLGQVKRELVTIGGWDYNKNRATKKIMHIHNKKWMKKGSHKMPTPRHSLVVISSPSHLIAAGGITDLDTQYTDVVEIYSIETTQWIEVESLPKAFCRFQSLGILNDHVYIIGNKNANNRLNNMYCASLDLLLLSSKQPTVTEDEQQVPSVWKEVASAPMYSPTGFVSCDIILAMGGYKNAECCNAEIDSSIYAYSPTLNAWMKVGDLPNPLAELTVASLPAKELLMIGGINEDSQSTKTVHKAIFQLSIR